MAINKRRIPFFPNISSASSALPTPPQCKILDALMSSLQSFPEQADEIAGALYEGDEQEVLKRLAEMKEMARRVPEGVRRDWNAQEDGFSEWFGRWVSKVEDLDLAVDEGA